MANHHFVNGHQCYWNVKIPTFSKGSLLNPLEQLEMLKSLCRPNTLTMNKI